MRWCRGSPDGCGWSLASSPFTGMSRERATGDWSFHVRGSLGSGGGGEELAERAKAQVRARVEHPFLVVKRQFGYVKVRYRGLAKNTAPVTTLFALSNLWMVRHTVRVGEGGACPEAFGRRPGGPAEASRRSADRARNPLSAGGTTSRRVTGQVSADRW